MKHSGIVGTAFMEETEADSGSRRTERGKDGIILADQLTVRITALGQRPYCIEMNTNLNLHDEMRFKQRPKPLQAIEQSSLQIQWFQMMMFRSLYGNAAIVICQWSESPETIKHRWSLGSFWVEFHCRHFV